MFDADIDIRVDDADWHKMAPDLEPLIQRAVAAVVMVMRGADYSPKIAALSIALVSDTEMTRLNGTYRGKNTPTNVLSFPVDAAIPLLGDIAAARETIAREASEKSISPADHLAHMIVHGVLHLQGFDHQNEAEAKVMETLEIEALDSLGITNPYETLS